MALTKSKENKKKIQKSEIKIGSLVFVKTVTAMRTIAYKYPYGTSKTAMPSQVQTGGTATSATATWGFGPSLSSSSVTSWYPTTQLPIYTPPMPKESTTNSPGQPTSKLESTYKNTNSGNNLKISQMSNKSGFSGKKTTQPVKALGPYSVSTGNLNGPAYTANTNEQSYALGYKTLNDFAGRKATTIKQSEKLSTEEKKKLGYAETDCYGKPFHGIVVDRFIPNNKSERGEVFEHPQINYKLYKVLFGENHLMWYSEEDLTVMSSENKEKKNGSTNQ